jgi:hypothetical protein
MVSHSGSLCSIGRLAVLAIHLGPKQVPGKSQLTETRRTNRAFDRAHLGKLKTMHEEALWIFLIRKKDEDTTESALLDFAICLYCPSNSLEDVVKLCPDTRVAGLRHANEDNCRNGIGCIWCHEGFCGVTGIGPGLPVNRIDPW